MTQPLTCGDLYAARQASSDRVATSQPQISCCTSDHPHHLHPTSTNTRGRHHKVHTTRPRADRAMPLWNSDTIKDVSESVGIINLGDDLASELAQDVEYRIHQVVQEALKFMRHSKRTTLVTTDISNALRVLNIEPLYGYASTRPLRFGEASLGQAQPIFYVEDDEVDFEKLINAPLPKVPREVSFTCL